MPRKTFRKKYGKRKSSRRNYKQRRTSLKKRGGKHPLIDFKYDHPTTAAVLDAINSKQGKCDNFTIKYLDGHEDTNVRWQTIYDNRVAYLTGAFDNKREGRHRPQNIQANC